MSFNCPNCGTQLVDGTAVCVNCGIPLQNAAPQGWQPVNAAPAAPVSFQQQAQPAAPASWQPQANPQQAQFQQGNQYNQGYQTPGQFAGNPQHNQFNQGYQGYQNPVQYGVNPEYQNLGGWLLVFVVLSALSVISYVVQIIQLLGSMSLYTSLGGMFTLYAVLSILSQVVGLVAAGGFIYFVVQRNHIFLRFYQIMAIVSMALALVEVIATAGAVQGSYAGAAIGGGAFGLILGIALLALYTMYFCKSVRVRTYMGSMEYINRALFKVGV